MGKEVIFSYEELIMLSDGLLTMGENANKAMALVRSSEAIDVLRKEVNKYIALNQKVCDLMGCYDEDGNLKEVVEGRCK